PFATAPGAPFATTPTVDRALAPTARTADDDVAAARAIPHSSSAASVDVHLMSAPRRWRRALQALAKVMADPTQTDQVLVFAVHANAGSMQRRIARFRSDPAGRRLIAERRTIDSRTIDLEALAALPADTLGHAYATFLRSRGLTPAVFDDAPPEVSDPTMGYVVQRLRQTHDLWHVVTGHDTDAGSEVALQAFTYAQLRAPSALILALFGTLRGLRLKPGLARDVLSAFRTGLRAEKLAAFPWEDHWATPLDDVRGWLGLPRSRATA
nr:ubiquinone biosynthesis protein COQ4 [Myxococcota bacterium]